MDLSQDRLRNREYDHDNGVPVSYVTRMGLRNQKGPAPGCTLEQSAADSCHNINSSGLVWELVAHQKTSGLRIPDLVSQRRI
jgi:hypothetical protein